jgi:hypothetical protein
MSIAPTASWRQNPNLADCFEDCVAMFHSIAERATSKAPAVKASPSNTDESKEPSQ